MRPSCKSASEALAESPLAGLLDQARLLDRISALIAEIDQPAASSAHPLPPLRCAIQGQTVIITAGNSSQAAKLRQRTAALHQILRERVPHVTAIRIRLQPGGPADADGGGYAREVPAASPAASTPPAHLAAALRFAEELCRDLHDSPLRQSALRLRASLRARLPEGR
jgi:hypothetical protein